MLIPIPASELLLHPDGSIYHLHLKPGQIADTIITVGDPSRVEEVSRHFDSVEYRTNNREFISHTGYLNKKPITVISSGIGSDNIDIVMNELDALVNIDFETLTVKENKVSLNIIRLGTSGSIREDIDVDTILVNASAFGMDGMLHYYNYENTLAETDCLNAFTKHMRAVFPGAHPYLVSADNHLLNKFETHFQKGITVTTNGFYAPQGRVLRAMAAQPGLVEAFRSFQYPDYRITNFEMETAAIYGLGKILGHRCLSVNAIVDNRILETFSANPQKTINRMIEQALQIIAE